MTVYLIQLLLPQYDNSDRPFDAALFAEVRHELIEQFGGVTAYTRAPASGAWTEDDGSVARDDIFIYEVMTDAVDREWWAGYRDLLQARFRQDEMVVRALTFDRL
jgi:hypothetical protein